MFSNHKSNLVFIYIQCIVTAIIAFVYSDIFFSITNTALQIVVYVYLVCSFFVWLIFGHFNDVFFNLSSVIGFAKIYHNIGKVKYLLATNDTYCFYYTDSANMYTIYLKGNVVTCMDKGNKAYFMIGEHPFMTIQSILRKKIEKHLTQLHVSSSNNDEISNFKEYQIAEQAAKRKHKIDSILS